MVMKYLNRDSPQVGSTLMLDQKNESIVCVTCQMMEGKAYYFNRFHCYQTGTRN